MAIFIWSTALWGSAPRPGASAVRTALTDRLLEAQLSAYHETRRLEYLGAAMYTIEMRLHEVTIARSPVSADTRALEARRDELQIILGEEAQAAWSSFYRRELRATLRDSDRYDAYRHGRNLAIASAPLMLAGAVLVGVGQSLGEVPDAVLWVGVSTLVAGAVLLPTGLLLRHRGVKEAESELARRHITRRGVRF